MQTFLPFSSFSKSASCLDRQRLGKQRVEVLQLLQALRGEKKGWSNHPAAKMWRGYENALVAYGHVVCGEWIGRGYQDTCTQKIDWFYDDSKTLVYPHWLGNEAFHLSHQSNLLRKDYAHYSRFFVVPTDLDYIWPDGL